MTKSGKRVAWVTGGGSGIGEAGAEALAADGWIVVVSGRRREALDAVVAKIAKAGGQAEAIPLDVSVAADAEKVAGEIVARHGRIDLLVNSAGINVPKRRWDDMEIDGWNKLVEITQRRALLHARGAAHDASPEGRLDHQRLVLGGPPCLENAGPGLHHHQACGAGAETWTNASTACAPAA